MPSPCWLFYRIDCQKSTNKQVEGIALSDNYDNGHVSSVCICLFCQDKRAQKYGYRWTKKIIQMTKHITFIMVGQTVVEWMRNILVPFIIIQIQQISGCFMRTFKLCAVHTPKSNFACWLYASRTSEMSGGWIMNWSNKHATSPGSTCICKLLDLPMPLGCILLEDISGCIFAFCSHCTDNTASVLRDKEWWTTLNSVS